MDKGQKVHSPFVAFLARSAARHRSSQIQRSKKLIPRPTVSPGFNYRFCLKFLLSQRKNCCGDPAPSGLSRYLTILFQHDSKKQEWHSACSDQVERQDG